jgi:hypothetical protein
MLAIDPKRAETLQGMAAALASLAEGRRRQPGGVAEASELHRRALTMLEQLAAQNQLDADGKHALQLLRKGWLPFSAL